MTSSVHIPHAAPASRLGTTPPVTASSGVPARPTRAICRTRLAIRTGKIDGTCRLQTGERAAAANDCCSGQEFDFTHFEPYRSGTAELGRSSLASHAPALDRESGTIDFLTLNDLAALPAATSARFLS